MCIAKRLSVGALVHCSYCDSRDAVWQSGVSLDGFAICKNQTDVSYSEPSLFAQKRSASLDAQGYTSIR